MTDKATPRPWNRAGRTVLNFDGELVCGCDFEEDAALIVEAVNNYDAMKARIAELEAALREIERYVPKHRAGEIARAALEGKAE